MLKSSDTLADIDSSIESFACHKFVSSTPFNKAKASSSFGEQFIIDLQKFSPEECNLIMGVFGKDQRLKQFEASRLNNLAMEIKLEQSKQKLVSNNKIFADSHCVRCFSAFRIFFNPKKTCDLCRSYVCKKCSQIIKNISLKQQQNQKLLICFVCYKKKLLETSFTVARVSCAVPSKVKKKSSVYNDKSNFDESFLTVEDLSFFKRHTDFSNDISDDLDSSLSRFESNLNVRQKLDKLRADLQLTVKTLQQTLATDQTKASKQKYDSLLLESHEKVKVIISEVLSSLETDLKADGLAPTRLDEVAKILTLNEIEKCVKKSFAKDAYLNGNYEDKLASSIIKKFYENELLFNNDSVLSANKEAEIKVGTKEEEEEEEIKNKSLKTKGAPLDNEAPLVRSRSESLPKLASKRVNTENILLSLNSLIQRNDPIPVASQPLKHSVPDSNHLNQKEDSDWQDNWSFVQNISSSQNKASNHSIKIQPTVHCPPPTTTTTIIPSLLNTKTHKSSSFYRRADERFESDSDTNDYSVTSQQHLTLSRLHDDSARIRPKPYVKDPMFELRPVDRLIRSGENVKFLCRVRGTKPLEVFWYKMNESDELVNNEKYEIFHDDEFYYLRIFNTIADDQGMYLCVISNYLEQNIDSFRLKLRDNSRSFYGPKFLASMQDVETEEGYPVTFKVKLDFGYPKARVLFYRNEELILHNQKHEIYYCGEGVYHLHIPNVTDEDNAKYTCVAVNNAGRVASDAELYVYEREKIRRPDMLLKLHNSSSYKLPSPTMAVKEAGHTISQYLNIDPFIGSTTSSNLTSPNNLKEKTREKSQDLMTAYNHTSRALLGDWPLIPSDEASQFCVESDTDDIDDHNNVNELETRESFLEEEQVESTVFNESNIVSMIYDSSKAAGEDEIISMIGRSGTIRLDEKRAENRKFLNAALAELSAQANATLTDQRPALLSIQDDYRQFKIEPVKKMTQLYESQQCLNTDLPQVKRNKSLAKVETVPVVKKWSSLQTINLVPGNTMKNGVSVDEKINEDLASDSGLKDSRRVVKKLKQKFDSQPFTKSSTLKIMKPRYTYSNSNSGHNNTNNDSIISNSTTKTIVQLEETPSIIHPKKASITGQINPQILNSISTLSLNSTCNSNNSTAPSFFTTSSVSSCATESSTFLNETVTRQTPNHHNHHQKQHKNNLGKEIKNLLDIAENRTRLLCKVYDSSINHDSKNDSVNIKRCESIDRSPIDDIDLSKIVPKDYKGIIGQNYLNSKRKRSNVIAKVTLWDELYETGELNADKWKKQFVTD